jgi:DNA helicase HerA-like ATPase
MLKLSKDVELPLDAVTQTFGIVAKKRRGKTYTASVMAEEMIKNGLPFVVLDPTGVWWGLRASRSR